MRRWTVVTAAVTCSHRRGYLTQSLCHCAKKALFCLALVAATPYLCFALMMDLVPNPWQTGPATQESYCLYNNTGMRVFVYHDKTGMKYTLEPGASGYPAYGGSELKFHPGEIRCGFQDACAQCVVRVAPFGSQPGLVLETIGYSQPQKVRQAPPAYVRETLPTNEKEPPRTYAKEPPRSYAKEPPRTYAKQAPPVLVKEPSRPYGNVKPQARVQERQPVHMAARFAVAQPDSLRSDNVGDGAQLLQSFLERMVHIYHRSRAAEKDAKLADLRDMFDASLARIVPKQTLAELEKYEAVCRCIHDRASAGMSLDEILRQKRCGDRSTKELRAEIIAGFRQRLR